MYNNFQKRVQKIRKLEERSEEIFHQKEAKKETVKKRQDKEFKRFYKHVQKEFISYILDIFEKYTIEYGTIKYIKLIATSKDFRRIRGTHIAGDLYLTNLETALDSSKIKHYFFLNITFKQPIILSPTERPISSVDTRENLESYTIFYKDYSPHENFAHVFFPNPDCYNKDYFSVHYPDIVLGIDGIPELLDAVCFDHEYEYYHLGEFSEHIWAIHDLLKIEHTIHDRHSFTIYLIQK